VILLDNGRLEAAHDPVMKQVYQCVRCASCLNVCPIWTLVGGHVYGHIYSGGIGAILTGLLNGIENFNQFSDLCIGCRTCTTVCPGKIPIPDLIDELRNRLCGLIDDFSDQRRIRKQLQRDVLLLDSIMSRDFNATWNEKEKCYEQ
jgi:L-lactate utilization protein LutB